MKKVVEQFVKYPFYASLIVVFLLIVGGASMYSMKKSFFPERPSRMLSVRVSYPGASPVEMEEGVTSRIEEAVRAIPGIYEINSVSSENMTNVSIEIIPGYDIDEALIEVKNAVDGISSFPTAAERPIVSKRRTTSPAMRLLVTGDVDLLTLKTYAQKVEEDFLSSGFISQVMISGYPPLEISVEASEENLLRYGITFSELQNAISQNNQDVSGGQIRSKEEELLIRLRSRSTDPNKIGDIIVRANQDGSFIRIRDLALVKKKFSDSPNISLEHGKPLINMTVMKLITEDLTKIDKYIRDYAVEFNEENPGVELIITRSYLEILGSRLELLYRNGGQGLILIIIVLGLMLSTRLSFWVAWGIPASFLAMFIVARMMGITINMMSLFGMILVIGILVDDGIVIGENIFQHFELGKSPMRAAVDGTVEVIPAVITSVLTTVFAFMPLIFITGRMEMMYEMAIIVILSLAFSLFETFFVLPAHLGNETVLNRKVFERKAKGLRKYTERFFTWFRDYAYDRVLKLVIEWRYIVIAVPAAMILITGGLIGGNFIKTTFFPRMEFDSFNINLAFTPGSGEKQTMEYLTRFDSIVWVVNDELKEKYKDSLDVIENSIVELGSAFSGQESGAHTGSVDVSPRNSEETGISSYEIIDMIREKIGPLPETEKFTIGGSSRFGDPVSIGLLSRNIQELETGRDYLLGRLSEMPQLKDIVNTNAMGKQEILLELKPKAYMLGLTENSLANQIRQAFYGGQAQRLQEGRDELRIWVRYPAEGRERIGQLERMKIITPQGEYPLTEIADYEMKRGPVNINRFNGRREIRVNADLVDPDASVTEILDQIQVEILPELNMLFPGIGVVFQGQQKESQRNMDDLMILFPLAFLGIIFILMINFKSFEQPFIILILVPISVLGAIWGHGIHGKPLSILSFFGIIALTGVIVNDAVVFLDKFNSLIVAGKKVKEAVLVAGKSRLRPIILTTLTTSLGLYPIVLEKSFQAQFLIPMAISLVYGVAFGTMFILLFFPALIVVLNDVRRTIRGLWYGRKFEAEEVEIAWIHAQRKFDDEIHPFTEEKNNENTTNIIYTFFTGFTAQAQQNLTLTEAITIALENNYDIKIVKQNQRISEITNNWGTAGRYPYINLSAGDNNSANINESENYIANGFSAGASLNWTLFDGYSVRINKQRFEELEQLSKQNTAIIVEGTIQSVVLAYYDVLLQKEKLNTYNEVMSLSEDRFKQAESRKEYGAAVTYEVLQAQNAYLSDRSGYLLQEVNYKNALRDLNYLMADNSEENYNLSDNFEAIPVDYELADLQAQMFSNNKGLQNQYVNQRLLENAVASAKSNFSPSINFNGGATTNSNRTKFVESGTTWNNSANFYGNFTLSYNLFSGGNRKRASQIARIDEEVGLVQIDDMKHDLTNSLSNLFEFYLVRKELLDIADENLAAAKLNLQISREKFDAGAINSFNFRDVQTLYLNAAQRRLEAIYYFIDAHTSMLRMTGVIVQEFE